VFLKNVALVLPIFVLFALYLTRFSLITVVAKSLYLGLNPIKLESSGFNLSPVEASFLPQVLEFLQF
jgi:hypothetical protein